ncbi:MAG: CCA tRNA nucleotidyltransferase [Anaerolineae bacterium]|nr:CCA tRNA nucleotidyltransferase [Anaerolineae bacterium]
MSEITPRQPKRPLIWSDEVLDLQDKLPPTEIEIYIVGGAVRDAYLHRPIKDLDLVTSESAIKFARQLANSLQGDVFVLDAERDVARVLLPDALTIDIATFRGADLLADLQDRDFTLNAMAVDLKGDLNLLIDPLDGEQDIMAKRVRRCSPDAIARDAIRGLRAIRQSVQLGFRLDAATLADVRAYGVRLRDTSGERIRDELFKLLALPQPSRALRVAEHIGLLEVIFPNLTGDNAGVWEQTLRVIDKLNTLLSAVSFARTDNTAATFEMGMVVIQFDRFRAQLNQHLLHIWVNDRPHRALLMLAVLLREQPVEIAEQHSDALRLSNAEKQRLLTVIKHYRHPVFSETVTPLLAHRYWYLLGTAGLDIMLVTLADTLGTQILDHRTWLLLIERVVLLLEAYYLRYEEIVMPPPVVDGNLLLSRLHLAPGPIIGELLTLIREGQVEKRVVTVEDALEAAKAYLVD